MRRVILVALLGSAMLGQVAFALHREDVIECGLADGSKFILRAGYDWYPAAKFMPHAAERLNQESFDAWYQLPGKKPKLARRSASSFELFRRDPSGEASCKSFGKKAGSPFIGATYFSQEKDAFVAIEAPDKIDTLGYVFDAKSTRERRVREDIEDKGWEASIYAAMQVGARVTWESSLVQAGAACHRTSWKSPCPVVAVFKYVSLDGGKTWQDPVITTEAEIFEIGRSVYEQSFIARPVRINGKPVKPAFPPPQVMQ